MRTVSLLPKTYKDGRVPPVLRHVLRQRGWTPSVDNFTLYWKNGRLSAEERAAYSHWITKKGHLQNLLKSAQVKFSQDLILKYEKSRNAKRLAGGLPPPLWIGKPSSSSRGRGIVLTPFLEDFSAHLEFMSKKEQAANPDKRSSDYDLIVVQEYITNPHLIAGYKYDLRLYVLVRSFNPLVAHIYDDGYSLTDTDLLRHLTNSSIQQKVIHTGDLTPQEELAFNQTITPLLGEGDFAKRTVRSLFAHLRNSGIDYKKVWREIIHVITLSLLALAPSVRTANPHAFELFGFDILLTQDLKPHLIEVNLAPSLAVSGPTDHIVKQPLVSDVLDLVFGVEQNAPNDIRQQSKILGETNLPSVGGFNQIFPFNQETSTLVTSSTNAKFINESRKYWLGIE